jgi:hypothetical protein
MEVFVMLRKTYLLLPAALLMLYGCGSHYMVRDPESGATYYTTEVDRTGEGGAVKFKDEATGSKVIIQQSEVRKVSEDEYEAGIKKGK